MTDTKRLRELAYICGPSLNHSDGEKLRSLILAACDELEAAREDAPIKTELVLDHNGHKQYQRIVGDIPVIRAPSAPPPPASAEEVLEPFDQFIAEWMGPEEDGSAQWVADAEAVRDALQAELDRLGALVVAPPPSDLTHAQELLREWREAADRHSGENKFEIAPEVGLRFRYDALTTGVWLCELTWEDGTEYEDSSSTNPLAAVRAAISATPWASVGSE